MHSLGRYGCIEEEIMKCNDWHGNVAIWMEMGQDKVKGSFSPRNPDK
jgi:hypothetical protein